MEEKETETAKNDYSLKIGCHLSCARGYAAMAKEALTLGANVFQFFSRNPRGSKAKSVSESDVKSLIHILKENNFGKLLIHAPYTLNVCSNDPSIKEITHKIISEDLQIFEKYLPGNMYNVHPGYRCEQTLSEAINSAVAMLNSSITSSQSTTFLLETMSGKGTEVGSTFEELRAIISEINYPQNVGVCLDTCHVFAAGYDIISKLDSVLDEFDRVIGLSKLFAIHLNDSLMPFGSHKDRHAPLGKGFIGIDAIERIINHRALRNLPFYLETPDNEGVYAEEIKLIKSLYQ